MVNLADPISDSQAVSLRYFKIHKPKPLIWITGEAVGPITAETPCFSFGALGAKSDVSNSANSGVVLPADGRIVRMTACSINSNGMGASPRDVTFGVIGDGMMGVEPGLIVTIPGNATIGAKTIDVEHKILQGGVLNFYSTTGSRYSKIAIVSILVELDI